MARKLGFTLLSDTERKVGEVYEVSPDPADPGAGFALRITYLINPEGEIAAAYDVRDIGAHPDEVLADLRAMGS